MRLVALALLLGGCAPMIAARVGRAEQPRPADCALRFDRVEHESAVALASGYQLVGTILLRHGASDFAWDDKTEDAIRPRACALGGDLVAYAGIAFSPDPRPWDEGTFIDFSVYRKR